MASDVNLRYTLGGDGVHVIHGSELVVHRGDVNIVYIEQNAAVGAFHDFGQELPLSHLGTGEGGVAADVLDGDGNIEIVLHHADALDGALDGLPCVGKREQVVRIGSVHTAPAEVIAEPGSLGPAD